MVIVEEPDQCGSALADLRSSARIGARDGRAVEAQPLLAIGGVYRQVFVAAGISGVKQQAVEVIIGIGGILLGEQGRAEEE